MVYKRFAKHAFNYGAKAIRNQGFKRALPLMGMYNAYRMAKTAYRGVRYLKGLVNSEKFHKDTNVAGNVTPTPTVTHLTAIATGDADANRTGNSLLVKGLSCNATLSMPAALLQARLRMVIVRDKQQIGDTAPAFTDIFSSSTPDSLMNVTTLGRFDILYDKVFTLSQGGNPTFSIRKYFKMYSHIRFNGSTSTDIQKNGIYLCLVSDDNTNPPVIASNWRIFYHDN